MPLTAIHYLHVSQPRHGRGVTLLGSQSTVREFKIVGKRIPPRDAFDKVTGTGTYVYDMELPGMLYAKLVQSTKPHAKIKGIDYSKALQVPGVVSVATGRDFPFRIGIYVGDRDLLAIDKVLWVGHPVAAVIADSVRAAEKALDLIYIDYDPLPAVFDPIESMKPDAPLLHPDLGRYRVSPAFKPRPGTNIANEFHLKRGDIEKGFSKAEVVVEGDFSLPFMSHVYMETQAVIAHYRQNGYIDLWTSAQSPFAVRYLMGMSLGMPMGRIRVHVPYIGGGFGGKAGLGWEPLVAMLSRKVGYKPVKLLLTRSEQFRLAPVVAGVRGWGKIGLDRNGRIVAYQARFIFDSGAFGDYTVNVSRTAGYACTGSYEIENAECESYAVYTNKIPTTALRGFGYPENHWVLERLIDKAAKELGMDPVKVRSLNLLKPGVSYTGTGARLREDAGNPQKVLEEVAKGLGWGEKARDSSKPWRVRTKGLAVSVKGPSQPPDASASAIIKFNEDASVDVLVGTGNFGQGTVTSLAMIVAEEFGIPLDKVHVHELRSTNDSAYTWQTVGSRGLFTDGSALLEAIRDAKNKIKKVASAALRVSEDHLEIADGKVYVKGKPWYYIPLERIVMGYTFENGNAIGGPIIGSGRHIAELNTYLDPDTGQGTPTIFYTFGGTGVEVEVDLLTGEVKVVKAVQAFDIGKAINPLLVEGQMIGGFVMGQSRALYEEIIFDEMGAVANPNLSFYYVARAPDIPEEWVLRIIETPQTDGPYGARGIGENVMIAVAPAIGNALFHGLGVDVRHLPMKAERVWRAIREQRPELYQKALSALKEEIRREYESLTRR